MAACGPAAVVQTQTAPPAASASAATALSSPSTASAISIADAGKWIDDAAVASVDASASHCTEVTEVKTRVEFTKRSTPRNGGFIVGWLIDPKEKRHELFAVPFPYNCQDKMSVLMPSPWLASVQCLGDDRAGTATITSDIGNIHVERRDYDLSSTPIDITLRECERARISVPTKFPSAH